MVEINALLELYTKQVIVFEPQQEKLRQRLFPFVAKTLVVTGHVDEDVPALTTDQEYVEPPATDGDTVAIAELLEVLKHV